MGGVRLFGTDEGERVVPCTHASPELLLFAPFATQGQALGRKNHPFGVEWRVQ